MALAAALFLTGCAGIARRPPTPAVPPSDPPVVEWPRIEDDVLREDLARRVREAAPGDWFQVLVDLRVQVDLPKLGTRLREAGVTKAARRAAVIAALESVAERSQGPILERLEELQLRGDVGFARPVAIVNRVVADATASGLRDLASHPDVARILPEWTSRRSASGSSDGDAEVRGPVGERFRTWAIDAIGAQELWDRGLDGHGVVVGMIDSGVHGAHEQLSGRSAPPGRDWYDPVEGRTEPWDSHGHGTSVLGIAVGSNPDGRLLGVAPGARWAVALGNHRNVYSRTRMTLAADWMLRVARPDVLINAWSNDRDPCEDFDLAFVDAWTAAGIFAVFPAGNAGPAPASGEAPAQLAGAYPGEETVFSVAALGPDGEVASLSSRGPSPCGDHPFPTLAAPGAELPFAFVGGRSNYGVGDGTSLAVGVVAGAAALILQAESELSPADLEDVLVRSARDVPPDGHDPATGAGRLDLPRALSEARRLLDGRRQAPPP